MKKKVALILIGLLSVSCSDNEENDIDCRLFDPILPALFIRLVDTNGNNLIENNTIGPNDVTILGGLGFRFNSPNEINVPDGELGNTLQLFIPNESEFEYTLRLNGTDNTLNFSAEFTRIPCDFSFYTPTEAFINNQTLELIELSGFAFLAEIEI